MKLIVGLGNPTPEYKNTYHNLGFMSVDKLAEKLNVSFSKTKCRAELAECRIAGEKVIIAKPQTYMNLSGESVRELVSFYKISLKDLIVVYDDFDLYKGVVRIREKGSAGTHNGMRNILAELGSGDFPRIRVGFKPTENRPITLINYVLSGISQEDKPVYQKAIDVASDAGLAFASGETIQNVMQKYNGKTN